MTDMTFADLEIRILHRDAEGYPVELTLAGQRELAHGYLAPDLLPWRSTGDAALDGQRLFEALFHAREVYAAWSEARGRTERRRVRLRIDPAAAELHALPWELIREGRTWLAADARTPFSRYLPVAFAWGRPITTRPVRVLVALSNPTDIATHYDLPALDVAQERAALQTLVSDTEAQQLSLEFLPPPITLERLHTALQTGVHVLHYVGHGRFSQRSQQAGLYLQRAQGNTHVVKDNALADMLSRQGARPNLVFLTACEGAARSSSDAFLGLGPKLVTAGMPAVVAMQEKVTLPTARQLSVHFYTRLLAHGIVDLALNEARSALWAAERPDAAVPVLFMRVEDGRLLAEDTPLPPTHSSADQHTERCHDLSQHIRETQALLNEYEREKRLARGPLERERAELEIQRLKETLTGYQAEYRELQCGSHSP
jgi:hypothetical protein